MPKLCSKCKVNEPVKNQAYCLSCRAEYSRSYRKTHKMSEEQRKKDICRSYLNVYVKRGKIKKLPCEICSSTLKIEAHHESYNYPLLVIWLCRICHIAVTNGEISVKELFKKKYING